MANIPFKKYWKLSTVIALIVVGFIVFCLGFEDLGVLMIFAAMLLAPVFVAMAVYHFIKAKLPAQKHDKPLKPTERESMVVVCPYCGSSNTYGQTVSKTKVQVKRRSALWWLFIGWWWLPIKWLCFPLIALFFKLSTPKKYEKKVVKQTLFVCRNCKQHWYKDGVVPQPTSPGLSSPPPEANPAPAPAPVVVPAPQFRVSISIDGFGDEDDEQKIDTYKVNYKNDKAVSAIKNYLVLDVETTGLDKNTDRIVEIGILEIKNGKIANEFQTFVNPQIHIPERTTKIHGITDEDVKDAPTYENIAPKIKDMVLDQTIVGYNVQFDIGFITKMLSAHGFVEGRLNYIDVLPIAKKRFPDLPNYKLQTVIAAMEYKSEAAHRAISDATPTYILFEEYRQSLLKQQKEAKQAAREKKEAQQREREEKYKGSPLLNVKFVFTGDFSEPREDMEQMALDVGALIRTKVTGQTDYLVVGDISELPEWAIERKYEKAQELIAEGQKVKLIEEDEYLSMISEAENALDF